MWRFRPGTERERAEFFRQLEGLYGVIPELKGCRVHPALPGSDFDAVLLADFESADAMERYLQDPRHKAVSALCKAIRTDRAALTYEWTAGD